MFTHYTMSLVMFLMAALVFCFLLQRKIRHQRKFGLLGWLIGICFVAGAVYGWVESPVDPVPRIPSNFNAYVQFHVSPYGRPEIMKVYDETENAEYDLVTVRLPLSFQESQRIVRDQLQQKGFQVDIRDTIDGEVTEFRFHSEKNPEMINMVRIKSTCPVQTQPCVEVSFRIWTAYYPPK
ncbi:hypothetical protein JW979_05070 [bacterium]|nr:hypothetical protein [candidate division CSSED10-310 bacterium]